MSDNRQRLETQAIVIGYAMSRLDKSYLSARGCTSWRTAYKQASDALSDPASTFKLLRDEFDPIHANTRIGWQRELRSSRQRVLDELSDVSDEALLELVDRIIRRDESSIVEAVDSLAVITGVPGNVAERLRTGRLAEEYFIRESDRIVDVHPNSITDCRQLGCGFDFGVHGDPHRAFEVKGLKELRGDILFTDREWQEARTRQSNYWLVVIGNVAEEPVARVIRNPHSNLVARDVWRQTLAVSWRASVMVSVT